MNPTKDTIYVDPEDEITSLIDKVQNSPQKIVALVLPKRAATLQSVVNMRLLKRSADDSDRRLVLITNEAGLLPLAGLVGVHVARNLTSKPAIPPAPSDQGVSDVTEDLSEGLDQAEVPPALDANKPVGELAAVADETETIDLEDDEVPPPDEPGKKSKGGKPKKNKKLTVPNFDKFRLWLIIGIVAVVGLVVFIILAIFVLPKAKLTLTTDTVPVSATLKATTSGQAKELDEANDILPGSIKELKQTATEKVPATGQKDVGTKATGTATISNCTDNPITIPAGTGISKGGLTYLTTDTIGLDAGEFNSPGSGGACKTSGDHVDSTDVIAQAPGDKYNVAPTSGYQVAGAAGDVRASGSQMSGGTSKVIRVATDQDLEGAKQKIAAKTTNTASDFYKQQEDAGFVVLKETGTNSDPKIVVTPGIGQEATEITVTQEVTYHVLAVVKSDLNKLLANALKKQIDTKTQEITPGDLTAKATIRVSDKKSATDVSITVDKSTTARPVIDESALKKEIAGKKRGDIEGLLNNRPGIKKVTVDFSPFWVSNTPKKTDKITIVINQAEN